MKGENAVVIIGLPILILAVVGLAFLLPSPAKLTTVYYHPEQRRYSVFMHGQSGRLELETITIEDCDYFVVGDGGGFGGLVHKGNCRNCRQLNRGASGGEQR